MVPANKTVAGGDWITIILSLLQIIEDCAYTLAVATHEDNKDAIATYITRILCKTVFTQRAREYVDPVFKEGAELGTTGLRF